MTEEEIQKAQAEHSENETSLNRNDKETERAVAKTELEKQKADNESIRLRHEEIELELKREELNLKREDIEIRRKELQKQAKKDIVIAVSTAAVKLIGIATCCITAGAFVGTSLRMMYQEQTVPPKSLGEGLKFITNVGMKLI